MNKWKNKSKKKWKSGLKKRRKEKRNGFDF